MSTGRMCCWRSLTITLAFLLTTAHTTQGLLQFSGYEAKHFPTAVASNISEQCVSDTQQFAQAFYEQQQWAVKMYESSGRLAEEMIHTSSGNVHHESGLFDPCLAAVQSSDGVRFRSQYCTVFFDLKPTASTDQEYVAEPYANMSNFRMPTAGFCLPSTCSADDLRSAVAQQLRHRNSRGANHTVVTVASEDYCYTGEKLDASGIKSDYAAIAALVTFALLAAVVLVATFHEIWRETYWQQPVNLKKEKFGIRFLHCFSALNNGRKLMATEEEAKDGLSCLHGLRVVSTYRIVIQHATMEILGRSSYNRQGVIKAMVLRRAYGAASLHTIAVDTFFLMSGLLVAYSQMRKLGQQRGEFNLKQFYLHRYFRLTLLYATLIAFIITLLPHVGSGPDWHYIRLISKSTSEHWWVLLLYIQNLWTTKDCWIFNPSTVLTETWYLACDMHMFILSPLFIYPLWRWKKAGLVWTVFSLITLLTINVIIFIVNDIPPIIIPTRPTDMEKVNDYIRLHYVRTYARIPVYLIGILLGWLLHNTKHLKIQINRYLSTAIWVAATLVGLVAMFGLVFCMDEDQVPIINPFIRVSYGALHRSAWALAMGWLIFACTHGYGGFVQRFLSWKFFMPLSRLSYAAYLIHPIYIKVFFSLQRKPMYVSFPNLLTTFWGILVPVFLLSAIVSVVVEMPFLNLDKLLIPEKSHAPNSANNAIKNCVPTKKKQY